MSRKISSYFLVKPKESSSKKVELDSLSTVASENAEESESDHAEEKDDNRVDENATNEKIQQETQQKLQLCQTNLTNLNSPEKITEGRHAVFNPLGLKTSRGCIMMK